jgi:hypothetical protein
MFAKKMKLCDFLEKTENRNYFSEKLLQHFEDNLYMCEVHEIDLMVGDGFRLIHFCISYDHDFDFEKNNPNSVWFYKSWNRPEYFDSEETKLVFCEVCEANREDMLRKKKQMRRKSKKKKGRKSKKHKTEQTS